MKCTPCDGEIVPGQKVIAVTKMGNRLIWTAHCEHTAPPPPDAIAILASLDCAQRWMATWIAQSLMKCGHTNKEHC